MLLVSYFLVYSTAIIILLIFDMQVSYMAKHMAAEGKNRINSSLGYSRRGKKTVLSFLVFSENENARVIE